jgi:hypothetical protein
MTVDKSHDILAALVDECFLEESERSSESRSGFNTETLMTNYNTLHKSTPKDDSIKVREVI